ncbi:hypothetical protein R1flu_003794 [Riccia fluitans]|uniref:Dirigent protein n=1 Tax=Riccia fluitans TaxID=41844 RepID=A0ABD1YB04_9MARC
MDQLSVLTVMLCLLQISMLLSLQQKVEAARRCGSRHDSEAAGPITLYLYNHETMDGDNRTMITSAAPNGNLTEPQFGRLITMSNILRKGVQADSERIGTQQGFVAVGRDGLDVYISIVYHLNEASGYNGSTISVQGHIDARTPGGLHTFAVVGGTGQFLGEPVRITLPVCPLRRTGPTLSICTL